MGCGRGGLSGGQLPGAVGRVEWAISRCGAQLLEEHGTSNKELQRAFQINEKILRKDRTRDDVRLRQIRLADRLGQHADVAVHLGILREQRSDLADVWYYSGLVAEETGDRRSAIQYYQTAVALENPSAETYEHLARLLTSETGNTQAAEDLLQQLRELADSVERPVEEPVPV